MIQKLLRELFKKNPRALPVFISCFIPFALTFFDILNKKFQFLPALSNLQISGDSMLPIPDKAYVTAEYIENWNNIKDGSAYIILTKDDGIVFKVIYNQMRTGKKLLLKSLNPLYEPYEININEVKEIWKFINYISNSFLPYFNLVN